jgi:ribosomal protein L40E
MFATIEARSKRRVICQLCGTQNSPDAHCCFRCDARLITDEAEDSPLRTLNTRPCPRCGTLNNFTMRNCVECTRELTDAPLIRQETFGSSRRTTIACLTIVRSNGQAVGRCPLHGPDAVVGCYNDLFGKDPYLTPRHVGFRRNGDCLVVQDLGSLCGTYLRIRREVIFHGDVFRVGRELLRYIDYENDRSRARQRPELRDRLSRQQERDEGFWGELVIMAGISPLGDRVMLRNKTITIGRVEGDIVFCRDDRLSGSHARLSKRDDGLLLEDLDSRRGTFVRLVGEKEVPFGSELIVGETRLGLDLPQALELDLPEALGG